MVACTAATVLQSGVLAHCLIRRAPLRGGCRERRIDVQSKDADAQGGGGEDGEGNDGEDDQEEEQPEVAPGDMLMEPVDVWER